MTWPLAHSRLLRKAHLVCIDIEWKRSAQCRRPSAGNLNRSAGALAHRGRSASRARAPSVAAPPQCVQSVSDLGARKACIFSSCQLVAK